MKNNNHKKNMSIFKTRFKIVKTLSTYIESGFAWTV